MRRRTEVRMAAEGQNLSAVLNFPLKSPKRQILVIVPRRNPMPFKGFKSLDAGKKRASFLGGDVQI